MPMRYLRSELLETELPPARFPFGRHLLTTYASETNKTAAIWREYGDADLAWRPAERASTVEAILRHQLLSERRFFAEFLGTPEPPAEAVLPPTLTVAAAVERLVGLARARLPVLAAQSEAWWLAPVPFFDVERERIWVFWRRVLHSTHHRAQLVVYLRLLGRRVPPTYGPTADVEWAGADPTHSVEAAARRTKE